MTASCCIVKLSTTPSPRHIYVRRCQENRPFDTQKLVLAKVLFKNSPIVILDEPSSALDAFAEDELITFNKTLKGRTVFYVSHRLSIAKYADQRDGGTKRRGDGGIVSYKHFVMRQYPRPLVPLGMFLFQKTLCSLN